MADPPPPAERWRGLDLERLRTQPQRMHTRHGIGLLREGTGSGEEESDGDRAEGTRHFSRARGIIFAGTESEQYRRPQGASTPTVPAARHDDPEPLPVEGAPGPLSVRARRADGAHG